MADMDTTSALTTPVETTLVADIVRPRQLVIDAEAQQIVLTVSKGHMDGAEFVETFRDSVTLKNETNEDGTPGTQWYDVGMDNLTLAQMVRSAPAAVSFGRIMREACTMIMRAKGMVS